MGVAYQLDDGGNKVASPVYFKTSIKEKDYEKKNLIKWGSKTEEPAVSRSFRCQDCEDLWNNWIQEMLCKKYKMFEYGMYPLIAVLCSFYFCNPYFFPDGNKPACDDTLPMKNEAMCGLARLIEREIGEIRTLMAFILGGFILSTLALWRTRRNNYAVLCGRARTMIIQFGALLPRISDIEHDMENINRRETMLRWVVLGYELAVLKGRSEIDSHEGRKHLEFLGLLHGDEWEKMVEGDRHTTVWYWIQSKAADLCTEGVISESIMLQFCDLTADMRNTANDLMSKLDRDQAIPYSAIVGALVNLNLVFFTALKAVEWSIWNHEKDGTMFQTPRGWAAFLFFICYVFILSMLYDMCIALYNPFGWRTLDIPHNIIGGGIRNLAKKVALGENFPSTMKSSNYPQSVK